MNKYDFVCNVYVKLERDEKVWVGSLRLNQL